MDLNQRIIQQLQPNLKRLPAEIPNFGRDELAKFFAEVGLNYGAEIGVESGAYSEILCKFNPNLHLLCVDAWQPYKGYMDYAYQQTLSTSYETAKKVLSPYNNVTFIRKFSMDAVKDVEDNSLDFVYIDGNHTLQYVINDICEWSKKVRPGGIVSGHDYHHFKKSRQFHVIEAVNAYTQAYYISPWFTTDIKKEGRSWFWVKR